MSRELAPHATASVPGLFARNERIACVFDTIAGPMAVVLVGALFVGSMSLSWLGEVNADGSGVRNLSGGRDPLALTLDACLAAIADAGLTPRDIDGLATYPGPSIGMPAGFTGAGVVDVQDALRLELDWYDSGIESSGQLGSVVKAAMAVACGLATHVLCFRSVWEGSAQGAQGRKGIGAGVPKANGPMEWSIPFSAASAAVWIAMYAQLHFHRYGTTREQLAWIALNGRRHAAANPKAIYRDPLTLDAYLGARVISTPFGLFDCDVPCDGATAVIVSARTHARDLRRTPIGLEAVGTALRGRPSWDQFDDLTQMANRDAARHLWSRTDLTPDDRRVRMGAGRKEPDRPRRRADVVAPRAARAGWVERGGPRLRGEGDCRVPRAGPLGEETRVPLLDAAAVGEPDGLRSRHTERERRGRRQPGGRLVGARRDRGRFVEEPRRTEDRRGAHREPARRGRKAGPAPGLAARRPRLGLRARVRFERGLLRGARLLRAPAELPRRDGVRARVLRCQPRTVGRDRVP